MNRDDTLLIAAFIGAVLIFGLMVAVGLHHSYDMRLP